MGSNEGKLLFGLEVELGFAALNRRDEPMQGTEALSCLMQICADRFVHLPGRGPHHLFLANGALVYPDVGHPEIATAESSSPTAMLQSLRAVESMMAAAVEQLESSSSVDKACLYRTNVDYSRIGITWGCHESYLSRGEPAWYAHQVVDHLVTRIIYSGAGGFDNKSYGASFVLSPRAAHLGSDVGPDNRESRAIFSLRQESLSKDYHRVHLICGEPNCAELSTYLKVGTTALVLAMADAGIDFGDRGRRLGSAVKAMGRFSLNAECRAQSACGDGIKRSALEVQRNYLELAERHVDHKCMPEWAEEVCMKWRSVLDRIESDPESLVGSLDWPTKLALFKRHVSTHTTMSWHSLPVWSSVARRVSRALSKDQNRWPRVSSRQIRDIQATKGALARLVENLTSMLDEHGLEWDELDAFHELRDQLCELDVRYGQLYPQGIYLDLEEAGQVRDRILEASQIEAATDSAPNEGRARVRGDWIRDLASKEGNYNCDWTIIAGDQGSIDLGDPFVTEAAWRENKIPNPAQRRFEAMQLEIPVFLRSQDG